MHVFPAPGLKVRDPVKKDLLPESGREVSEHDPFWARRIAHGDVVVTQPTTTQPATSSRTRSIEE
jgi:hypothetical protein